MLILFNQLLLGGIFCIEDIFGEIEVYLNTGIGNFAVEFSFMITQ